MSNHIEIEMKAIKGIITGETDTPEEIFQWRESRLPNTNRFLARIQNEYGACFYVAVKPMVKPIAFGDILIPLGVFDPVHPLDQLIARFNDINLGIPTNSSTEAVCGHIGIPVNPQGEITSYTYGGFQTLYSESWGIAISRNVWNLDIRGQRIDANNDRSDFLPALSAYALSQRVMAEFPNVRITPATHHQLQLDVAQYPQLASGSLVDYSA